MKNTRNRSLFIYFILFGFIAGLVYFIYEFIVDAHYWAMQPINRHLSEGVSDGGKILDRNGVVLSETKDGKRKYADDADVRRAMLHVVGDGCVLIPTSVQSRYTQELFGYNIVTGLGAPKTLNTNKDIELTLESKICSTVCKAFKKEKGTAIAYNYVTGEIICMVSLPTYDVYNKPDLSKDSNGEYEGVYINRALSSSFVPGSIFKVITAAVALDCIKDVESKTYKCERLKIYDGEKVTCMSSHGKIGIQMGLCKSCDIVFGDIAVDLGRDVMQRGVEKFGFNKPINVDGITLAESKYDLTDASEADLAWSGIGQYKDLVNPMHMLMIMGAFANGGIPIQPHVVGKMLMGDNIPVFISSALPYSRMTDGKIADKVKSMMRYTMKNQYGDSMFPGMKICAKTGTGEVGNGEKPQGWMVGFSEDKNFPVAFVVIVENSGFGIKTAGPIASIMMKEIRKSY